MTPWTPCLFSCNIKLVPVIFFNSVYRFYPIESWSLYEITLPAYDCTKISRAQRQSDDLYIILLSIIHFVFDMV